MKRKENFFLPKILLLSKIASFFLSFFYSVSLQLLNENQYRYSIAKSPLRTKLSFSFSEVTQRELGTGCSFICIIHVQYSIGKKV